MAGVASMANVRDKIELLQFSEIEIDPSKPSIDSVKPSVESLHKEHIDLHPDCGLCAQAYHDDSNPKDNNA